MRAAYELEGTCHVSWGHGLAKSVMNIDDRTQAEREAKPDSAQDINPPCEALQVLKKCSARRTGRLSRNS